MSTVIPHSVVTVISNKPGAEDGTIFVKFTFQVSSFCGSFIVFLFTSLKHCDSVSSLILLCVRLFSYLTDINDCLVNACQHGSTCVDEINQYSCLCAAGYSGTYCQTGEADGAHLNYWDGTASVSHTVLFHVIYPGS